MPHRLTRSLVVLMVASLIFVFGAAASAVAEGLGDPHATDARGDPHADDATGDPHVASVVEAVVTATATATAVEAASAPDAPGKPDDPGPANNPDNNGGGNGPPADPPDPPQVGKPADGSVGNADDKSPKGQRPNDKNRGYECDDNKGIGRGNPAHSATCPSTPTTPTTPTTVTPASTSVAATTATTQPASVLGVQLTRASPAAATLARTGSDLDFMVAVAIGLLLGGGVLVHATRRREVTAD